MPTFNTSRERAHLPGCVLALFALLVLAPCLRAQDDGGGQRGGGQRGGQRGQFGGQPPIGGTVTSVAGDTVTIKTEAGEVYRIILGPNTRLMRERQSLKPSEIQVGDVLTGMGEVDAAAKTVHAAFAMDISAEQVKKMRDGLGKEWIAGRVTAIDDTTLTIRRMDNVTQKIQVDETTSFRKGRGGFGGGGRMGSGMGGADAAAAPPQDAAASGESVTLADIKVGDNITGRGGMKGEFFVPTVLAVSTPPAGGGRRRASGAGTAPGSVPEGAPPVPPSGPGAAPQ